MKFPNEGVIGRFCLVTRFSLQKKAFSRDQMCQTKDISHWLNIFLEIKGHLS